MKTEIVKFYGKEIPCVNVENVIMIGVKPICENIGLDYRAQCDAIKNDEILCQLVGVHHIVAAEIELLEKINELNETKNRAALELRENKLKLEKIRAERLKNEPTLFD